MSKLKKGKYHGRPCKNCGNTYRYAGSNCIACSNKRSKQWHKDNKEQAIRNTLNWRKRNKSKWNEYMRKYNKKVRDRKKKLTQKEYQ